MKAKEILTADNTAIIIFTDGRNLTINKDGTGTSGVWRIAKKVAAEKVIIYHPNKIKNKNEIYLGDFVQLLPSTEKAYPKRLVVEFADMNFIGTTDNNWNQFTDTKQGAISPIKYLR